MNFINTLLTEPDEIDDFPVPQNNQNSNPQHNTIQQNHPAVSSTAVPNNSSAPTSPGTAAKPPLFGNSSPKAPLFGNSSQHSQQNIQNQQNTSTIQNNPTPISPGTSAPPLFEGAPLFGPPPGTVNLSNINGQVSAQQNNIKVAQNTTQNTIKSPKQKMPADPSPKKSEEQVEFSNSPPAAAQKRKSANNPLMQRDPANNQQAAPKPAAINQNMPPPQVSPDLPNTSQNNLQNLQDQGSLFGGIASFANNVAARAGGESINSDQGQKLIGNLGNNLGGFWDAAKKNIQETAAAAVEVLKDEDGNGSPNGQINPQTGLIPDGDEFDMQFEILQQKYEIVLEERNTLMSKVDEISNRKNSDMTVSSMANPTETTENLNDEKMLQLKQNITAEVRAEMKEKFTAKLETIIEKKSAEIESGFTERQAEMKNNFEAEKNILLSELEKAKIMAAEATMNGGAEINSEAIVNELSEKHRNELEAQIKHLKEKEEKIASIQKEKEELELSHKQKLDSTSRRINRGWELIH